MGIYTKVKYVGDNEEIIEEVRKASETINGICLNHIGSSGRSDGDEIEGSNEIEYLIEKLSYCEFELYPAIQIFESIITWVHPNRLWHHKNQLIKPLKELLGKYRNEGICVWWD